MAEAPQPPYQAERAEAERLAREAGAIALRHRAEGITPEYKIGDEPVTAADREINSFLEDAFASRFPSDAILAEESPPDPRRFERARTWMLDPIDGTREFIEGTENWEIFIGLVEGGEPVVGVAYNPCTDTLLSASRGGGSTIDERGRLRKLTHTPSSIEGPKVLLVRRGATPAAVQEIAAALGIDRIDHEGGFGARAIHGIESGADVVLHLSGAPREWDTCAIQILAEESGAAMVNCRGERFSYLKKDLTQPHGMLLTSALHLERVLDVVTPRYEEWAATRR